MYHCITRIQQSESRKRAGKKQINCKLVNNTIPFFVIKVPLTFNKGVHMLQPLSGFKGYAILATDGTIGHVSEFYFDDENWTIRYLVANTGNWLHNRKVLISVVALGSPDWTTQTFPVQLTRDQVENSPDIDTESPVHRHHEVALHNHYQWPIYWEGLYPDSLGFPAFPGGDMPHAESYKKTDYAGNPHIQSTLFLTGSQIRPTDGEFGHIEDFIVDTETWRLSDLVVETGIWHFGKRMLVPMELIQSIDTTTEVVHLNCTREDMRNHREFDPLKPVVPQEEMWVSV